MNMPRCLALAPRLTHLCLAGSSRRAKMTPCLGVRHVWSLVTLLSHPGFLLMCQYLEAPWSSVACLANKGHSVKVLFSD